MGFFLGSSKPRVAAPKVARLTTQCERISQHRYDNLSCSPPLGPLERRGPLTLSPFLFLNYDPVPKAPSSDMPCSLLLHCLNVWLVVRC